jgi:hypothetical protein
MFNTFDFCCKYCTTVELIEPWYFVVNGIVYTSAEKQRIEADESGNLWVYESFYGGEEAGEVVRGDDGEEMPCMIEVRYHPAPYLGAVLEADKLFSTGRDEEARAICEAAIEQNGLAHCSADTVIGAYTFVCDLLAGETWPLVDGMPEISEVK